MNKDALAHSHVETSVEGGEGWNIRLVRALNDWDLGQVVWSFLGWVFGVTRLMEDLGNNHPYISIMMVTKLTLPASK